MQSTVSTIRHRLPVALILASSVGCSMPMAVDAASGLSPASTSMSIAAAVLAPPTTPTATTGGLTPPPENPCKVETPQDTSPVPAGDMMDYCFAAFPCDGGTWDVPQSCGTSVFVGGGVREPGGIVILPKEEPDEGKQYDGPVMSFAASFNGNQPACASGFHTSEGFQGVNWFQNSRPEAFKPTGEGLGDQIWIVIDAQKVLQFKREGSSDSYYGINGNTAALKLIPAEKPEEADDTPELLEYHDRSGNVYTFFGFDVGDRSSWSSVKGQLWKMAAAPGDSTAATTYVSNSAGTVTIDSAIAGFQQDSGSPTGRVATMFDSAGNRYTYTYDTSVPGLGARLESIAYEEPGSTTKLIWRVDYTYYPATDPEACGVYDGLEGDLKSVRITTPTSAVGVSAIRESYYRYYTCEFDGETSLGHPHMIKMVLRPEGVRRFMVDYNIDPTPTLGDDAPLITALDAANEATLKPYATMYIDAYDQDRRVAEITLDGECGCSGGATSTIRYTYDENDSVAGFPGYSDTPAYDGAGEWGEYDWRSRTVAEMPDGSFKTTYFDEWGFTMAVVVSDGDPVDSTPPLFWVTKYERDSNGRVVRTFTPESVTAYDHSTGAITTSTSVGLVRHTEYSASPYLLGPTVVQTGVSYGSSGTVAVERQYDYEDPTGSTSTGKSWKDVGDVRIGKPRVTEVRTYTAPSTHDAVEYTYTSWQDSSVDTWMVKKMTTTLPAVPDTQNGEATEAVLETYFREDGRPVFTKDAEGIWSFTNYDPVTGQVRDRVQDVDARTGHALSDEINDAATTFDITTLLPTADTGFFLESSYEYDDQGRVIAMTAPHDRTTAMAYGVLGDRRRVTVSSPSRTGTSTFTYHGPASYSVMNLAGKGEVQGTLTLGSTNSTADLASVVRSGTAYDAITAIDPSKATLVRLSRTLYTNSGARAEETRRYFTIPADLQSANDTSDKYDRTAYLYDAMGRVVRTIDPTNTISRTQYDAIGRPVESWTGTNDTGWPATSSGNMTLISVNEFDGGLVGNNHLTKVTADADGDWTGTTNDQRVTKLKYDYRGRRVWTENPVPPHQASAYDDANRVVASATFTSVSGLNLSTSTGLLNTTIDAAGALGNRVSLSTSAYDPRGRVYRSVQHRINSSTGAAVTADAITSNTWYDDRNRVIKQTGASIMKYAYDRVGRQTRSFLIAGTDDSATIYSDAQTLTGDIVLEESLTNYDPNSGLVLMSARFSRLHNAPASFTGPLDLNSAASSDAVISASDLQVSGTIHARPQITTYYYDNLDRQTGIAEYGTFNLSGSSSFSRNSSIPSRSDTILVSTTEYNADGTVARNIDPRNKTTAYVYDFAGRRIATIANVNTSLSNLSTPARDNDLYTRTEYTNGLVTKVWVDLNGNGSQDNGIAPGDDTTDQVTLYTYAATKPTSNIASNRLLTIETYPDSGSSSDVVTKRYNALGEEIGRTDQNGTILKTDYDIGGRITKKIVDEPGTNIDGAIRRIEMAYTTRGTVDTVTQYDAEVNGNVKDQVQYAYDDWLNVTNFNQDPDSAIGSSGRAPFAVAHAYNRAHDASTLTGWQTIRRDSTTLPGVGSGGSAGTITLEYGYGTASSIDSLTNRVREVELNSVVIAQYSYMGSGTVVGTSLPEFTTPITNNVFDGSGVYSDLDEFNRLLVDQWVGANHNLTLKYDENSNITLLDDDSGSVYDAGAVPIRMDREILVDGINRVVEDNLGSWSGSSFTSAKDQDWTLSQTGNWLNYSLGGVDFTRTHNAVNEVTAWVEGSGPSAISHTTAYDAAGQMTQNDRYQYVYDGFGRLVALKNAAGSPIATYGYNGLGFRIWEQPSGGGGGKRFFCYDERWRIVATFEDTNATPTRRVIHHSAGLAGMGDSSYIDSVILEDANNDTADAALETRFYPLQNWRADVVCVGRLNSGGFQLVEVVDYDTYGNAVSRPAISADYDRNGGVDGGDYASWFAAFEVGDASADVDLNGGIDGGDLGLWFEVFESGIGGLSPGACVNSGVIAGYAGYVRDRWAPDLYHVRHRVYDTRMGTWTRRDPLGYVDGVNLYLYVGSSAITSVDHLGLMRGDPPDCATYSCKKLAQRVLPDRGDCGAGITRRLTPDAPFSYDFSRCCGDHDEAYTTCDTRHENPNSGFIDYAFCECVHKVCDSQSTHPTSRRFCRLLARTYCLAVYEFGPDFFCRSQANVCTCCDDPVNLIFKNECKSYREPQDVSPERALPHDPDMPHLWPVPIEISTASSCQHILGQPTLGKCGDPKVGYGAITQFDLRINLPFFRTPK